MLTVIILLSFEIVLSQTQDEKEKIKKEKIITNQTLKELKGNISIMGSESEKKEEEKVELTGESPKAGGKDENYWRNLKMEIETKVAQAAKKMENLKEEINTFYRNFYSIDDPARREQIQVKIVESTRMLEEAQEELERSKKELEEFRERARKEGALPGWIR